MEPDPPQLRPVPLRSILDTLYGRLCEWLEDVGDHWAGVDTITVVLRHVCPSFTAVNA